MRQNLKITPTQLRDRSSRSQSSTDLRAAKSIEARSLEINPLVVTEDGRIVAADCRLTVDDYAVFRHPELGIEIAREIDHPPTKLERIAYAVEQADQRGTFYFVQMATEAAPGSKGLIGFHGAGGGGSMMAMDAVQNEGFTIANFTDTSGNPSAAKVYRAARIILAQPGLVGYFGSGSGVASQEQYWSAYGLAKAFCEVGLSIPVVIRLGGNSEDRAVADLAIGMCSALAFRSRDTRRPIRRPRSRDDSPSWSRVAGDLRGNRANRCDRNSSSPRTAMSWPIRGGKLWIDSDIVEEKRIGNYCTIVRTACATMAAKPAPTEDLTNKDSELIACEVECHRDMVGGIYVELPIPGLDDSSVRAKR